MPSISGQTLLVIGGSSGMGFAVAKLALAEGVRVAIASSNAEKVDNAVVRLKQSSDSDNAKNVLGFTVDLSHRDVEEQLEKLFTDVKAGLGDELLDHLVFTAGDAIVYRATKDIDLDFIQQNGMVRFVAPLLIGKLAPRFFKSHWSTSITFTSGKVAEKPLPEYTVLAGYAAGNAGVTRNLALDLAPIRVNQVNPGSVLTELWGPNGADRVQEMAKNTLLGKVGTPEDTAEAYIYLMKDTTANGTVINNSGGELLR
jgi:NAD(P)-dependent dehydrogenase (short-subunit alcohol dehydrogenase family)